MIVLDDDNVLDGDNVLDNHNILDDELLLNVVVPQTPEPGAGHKITAPLANRNYNPSNFCCPFGLLNIDVLQTPELVLLVRQKL